MCQIFQVTLFLVPTANSIFNVTKSKLHTVCCGKNGTCWISAPTCCNMEAAGERGQLLKFSKGLARNRACSHIVFQRVANQEEENF